MVAGCPLADGAWGEETGAVGRALEVDSRWLISAVGPAGANREIFRKAHFATHLLTNLIKSLGCRTRAWAGPR